MKTIFYKLIASDNHPSFARAIQKEDALSKLFYDSAQFGK
jgi:hypothetical protein